MSRESPPRFGIRGSASFYDKYEEAALWGKDLYEHLDYVYRLAAKYCVIFASQPYASKVWTSHERRSAQTRAVEENSEYILPARFDDTEIPGIRATVGHVAIGEKTPEELADLIKRKLGPRQRDNFLPPSLDRLFEDLELVDEDDRELFARTAYQFFRALKRLDEDERRVVFLLFMGACPAELPDNVHMSLDLLSRDTGFPPSQLVELFSGMSPVGFSSHLRDPAADGHELQADDQLIVLRWENMAADESAGNGTGEANAMIEGARAAYCDLHGMEALMRLDFSALANATVEEHQH